MLVNFIILTHIYIGMNKSQIRKEIRSVLYELMQNANPAHYLSGIGDKFPYDEEGGIVRLPQDIDPKEEYLVNWEGMSTNQDLYNFPMEEFKKGIEVERAKNNIFNILDIAEIVINNLEENPQFYSNLGI